MSVLWFAALVACIADPPPPPEDTATTATYLPDGDHDGTPDVDDCAPGDATIPAADDAGCDGVDDDCDGAIDEDAVTTTWYGDLDGDGAGDPDDTITACGQPAGYVATADDCDPGDSAVYPDAPELCDWVDQDCDGAVDDVTDTAGDLTWYRDADGDGWGVEGDSVSACFVPDGYVRHDGDCDDADPTRNPAEAEVCDPDDVDEDCDGDSDDDDWAAQTTPVYPDQDGDGWGDEDHVVWRCDPDDDLIPEGGDCDDEDASVRPDATDDCGDGVDADCDGEDPPC